MAGFDPKKYTTDALENAGITGTLDNKALESIEKAYNAMVKAYEADAKKQLEQFKKENPGTIAMQQNPDAAKEAAEKNFKFNVDSGINGVDTKINGVDVKMPSHVADFKKLDGTGLSGVFTQIMDGLTKKANEMEKESIAKTPGTPSAPTPTPAAPTPPANAPVDYGTIKKDTRNQKDIQEKIAKEINDPEMQKLESEWRSAASFYKEDKDGKLVMPSAKELKKVINKERASQGEEKRFDEKGNDMLMDKAAKRLGTESLHIKIETEDKIEGPIFSRAGQESVPLINMDALNKALDPKALAMADLPALDRDGNLPNPKGLAKAGTIAPESASSGEITKSTKMEM